MRTYTVRQAVPEDVNHIAEFNQAMALETEEKSLSNDTIQAGVKRMLMDQRLGFYLVAVDDTGPVACLGVTTEWSDWRSGFFWWIQSVYVVPEHRESGVFSLLYARVKSLAREHQDVCGVRLYVDKDNRRARRTYLRLGMKLTAYDLLEEEF